MDSDSEKDDAKQLRIAKVFRFSRSVGLFGRFDFEDFIKETGLASLMMDEDSPTTREELQRLYGVLMNLWVKNGWIQAVGHTPPRKGQRGRKMVLYQPRVPLNFTFGDEGIYEEALKKIVEDLQVAMRSGKDSPDLHQTAYKCIELAKDVLPKEP